MNFEASDMKYTPIVKNIRDYFATSTQMIWDRRNQIKVVPFLEEKIMAKSFKVPHFLNRVAYTFFRDSKAKRSYYNSIKILDFVPRPIGYREYKKFGLLYDSYYLCEQYAHDFTIREVLLDNDFANREDIFRQFSAFTYRLHMKGVKHLDYSPGNILVKRVNGGYKFKIIDLNRMQFKTLSTKERLENFSKLWANDSDLTFIIECYAKLIEIDEAEAVEIALKASKVHKDKKNLKKRLKGKKVVD